MNKLKEVLIITILSGAFLVLISSIYLLFKVYFIEIGFKSDESNGCINTYISEVSNDKSLNSLEIIGFTKKTENF